MISKKSFFTIMAIILVCFFMFQATEIVRSSSKDTEVNHYAVETGQETMQDFNAETAAVKTAAAESPETTSSASAGGNGQGTAGGQAGESGQKIADRIIYYIGKERTDTYDSVLMYAATSDRQVAAYGSLSQALPALPAETEEDDFPLVVIAPGALDYEADWNDLQKAMDLHISLVLTELPDTDLLQKNEDIRKVIGIHLVNERSIELTGLHIFSRYFLGGDRQYVKTAENKHMLDGIPQHIPWFELLGGAQPYVRGQVDTDQFPETVNGANVEMPPLLWRYRSGNCIVYTGFSQFFEKDILIGDLTVFSQGMDEFSFYPVINSRLTAFSAYPLLADENRDDLVSRYGRDAEQLQRDIMWETVSALVNRNEVRPTYFMSPELDYGDEGKADKARLKEAMELISETRGEAALSIEQVSKEDPEAVLKDAYTFLTENKPAYAFANIYLPDTDDLEAVGKGENDFQNYFLSPSKDSPLFEMKDGKLVLRMTTDPKNYTAMKDLSLRSLMTAYGYNATLFDIERAFYPQKKSDEWQKDYRKAFAEFSTFSDPYSDFDATTASETGKRVRSYLQSQGNRVTIDDGKKTITLTRAKDSPVQYYIFRSINLELPKKDQSAGVSLHVIDDDTTLVKVTGEDVTLTFRSKKSKVIQIGDEDDTFNGRPVYEDEEEGKE